MTINDVATQANSEFDDARQALVDADFNLKLAIARRDALIGRVLSPYLLDYARSHGLPVPE